MAHNELAAVQSHVSDDDCEYTDGQIDEQIKDLYKELEQTKVAIAKLREVSQLKATQGVQATNGDARKFESSS